MSEKKQKRNNKIEFLRFLFCIIIVILHTNGALWNSRKLLFNSDYITLALHGYIGVEFFFLVSGYLFAKKLSKLPCVVEGGKLADDTWRFLYNKIRPILPYHFFICGIILVLWLIMYPLSSFGGLFLDRLPSLFFLHRLGILGKDPKDLLGVEWYISSMLISMAILYPIGRKFGRAFRCLAPIAGLLICGGIMIHTGTFSRTNDVMGFTFKCNWRAFSEILIGIGCYEASEKLKTSSLSRIQKVLITVIEAIGYLLVFAYIFSNMAEKFDMIALCLLAMSVTISFSEKGYTINIGALGNKICRYLGKLSLKCYLSQVLFVSYLSTFLKKTNLSLKSQAVIIVLGTVVFSIITQELFDFARKARKKVKNVAAI